MLTGAEQILFLALLMVCGGIAAHTLWRRFRVIMAGRPASSGSAAQSIGAGLMRVLLYVPGQLSNIRNISLRDTAGLTHLFIFWGFYAFVAYFLILEIMGEGLGLFAGIRLHLVSIGFTHLLDWLALGLFLALLSAVARRAWLKLSRLGPHFEVTPMALMALAAGLMVACYFALQGLRDNLEVGVAGAISALFAAMTAPLASDSQLGLYRLLWWSQSAILLLAIVYIPFSRHQHPVFAPFNFFFSGLRNRGQLRRLSLQPDAPEEHVGARDAADLNRKQLLDLYSCTQCGRCQDACPAATTGKALSPKAVVNDLMHHVDEQAGLLPFWEKPKGTGTLADAIGQESIWQCTSCQACNDVCPVEVEPMQKLLEVRREQVMEAAEIPTELVTLYRNLETAGDPWGYGSQKRTLWAEGLDIPILGDSDNPEQYELLFWVGCTGAFDDQYRKITRSFARVLKQADVSFAILGSEERCSGDTARRTGNEWLYQELAGKNVNTFMKYGVRKIVTACPHCFNTLKNEYREFGLELEVMHHTELLQHLVAEGRLKASRPLDTTVTYHDACYLGRYNEIIDGPRELLQSLGATMVEPPRHGRQGRCCGAGGGMSQMTTEVGTRINEDRAAELIATDANLLATACPFCHQMVESGVEAVAENTPAPTYDIVQLVERATVPGEEARP